MCINYKNLKSMKTLLIIGLTVLTISLISCEKDTDKYGLLKGKWIETTQCSDTLIFNKNDYEGWLELNRGKEIRNGYLLPLSGSGLYDYKIYGDSISLQWLLSSCIYSENYYFNLDSQKEQIRIGNFFADSLSHDEILIFLKVQ